MCELERFDGSPLNDHSELLNGIGIITNHEKRFLTRLEPESVKLEDVTAVCMSSSGHLTVTLSRRRGVCYLFERELNSTFNKYTLDHHIEPVTAICITDDGNWLLTGTKSGSVKLMDLKSGPSQIIYHDICSCFRHHPGTINSASLVYRGPDQSALCAFIGSSYGIIFVDLSDPRKPVIHMGHGLGKPLLQNGYLSDKIKGPLFTPMSSDGAYGLSASWIDKQVKLSNWDLQSLRPDRIDLGRFTRSRHWSVGKYAGEICCSWIIRF